MALLHQSYYDFEHDDAYITYRYAANWAAGSGPVYNPGERVEGYSNFLLLALLRLGKTGGLDVRQEARAIGVASALALILLGYGFFRRVLRRPVPIAVAAAAAVALHGAFATWARSGLETVPFALAVFLAQWHLLRNESLRRGRVVTGVLFAVACLFRMDGVIFVAAAAAFLVVRRGGFRSVAALTLGFLVVFAPFFLWRWSYYGALMPNAFYAKVGASAFQAVRGAFYGYNFIEPFGGLLLFCLPLVLLLRRDQERDPARLLMAVSVIAQAAYVLAVGGDHMPMARFFVPVVMALTVLFLEAAVEMSRLLPRPGGAWGRLPAVVLVSCIVVSGALPTLNIRRLPASYAITGRVLVQQWRMAGRWLRANVDPGQTLATDVAGAVAYESGLPTIDMLGINDAHIARVHVPSMGHGTAGHEKRDFDYVLSRRPGLIFRGVRATAEDDGRTITQNDHSQYVRHCVPLGNGPLADDFGGVTQVPLFMWYDIRAAPESAVTLPAPRPAGLPR